MLRKLLTKLLPIHKHKILSIKVRELQSHGCCYWIVMDCPVQPEKILVVTTVLYIGDTFDPHFSNEDVIARFPPTPQGWADAAWYLTQGC